MTVAFVPLGKNPRASLGQTFPSAIAANGRPTSSSIWRGPSAV
jgi:hypothetical protein